MREASTQRLAGIAAGARRHARRRLNRAGATLGGQRAVARYLERAENPRLHLGCGGNLLAGWLNLDRDPPPRAAYADLTHPLPLPAAAFARVFSEHLIEHLDWGQGRGLLRECHRVLRPGGRIRLGTPDLERIVRLFAADGDEAAERYLDDYARAFLAPGQSGPAFVANQAFRGWGHRFLYDERTLAESLRAAGFGDIRRFPWGATDHDDFRGVEAAHDAFTRRSRAYETLCLEATRPR